MTDQLFEQCGGRNDPGGFVAFQAEERFIGGDQKLSLARFGDEIDPARIDAGRKVRLYPPDADSRRTSTFNGVGSPP